MPKRRAGTGTVRRPGWQECRKQTGKEEKGTRRSSKTRFWRVSAAIAGNAAFMLRETVNHRGS